MDKEDMKQNLLSLTERVYDDGLSPSIKVTGNAISDLLKFVALPFSFLGMTSDELLDRYRKFLEKSIKKVDPDKIISPEPVILTKLFEDVVSFRINQG